MPDINTISVTHVKYSWTSCAFQINGFPYRGITSSSWTQKRERKIVYAARQDGQPLGYTSGKYSVEDFKLKMLRDTATSLKQDLSILGLGSYGDAEFVFTAQHIEPVVGAIPITIVHPTVVIESEAVAQEEGIDELVTEFSCKSLFCLENGLQLASLQRAFGL